MLELLVALLLFSVTATGALALQLKATRSSENAARTLRAMIALSDYLQRAAMLPDGMSFPATTREVGDPGDCWSTEPCATGSFAAMQWSVAQVPVTAVEAATVGGATLPGAVFCEPELALGLGATLSWRAVGSLVDAESTSSCASDSTLAVRSLSAWIYDGGAR